MKKNDDFELLNNLPEECKDPEIKQEDFTLTDVDGSIHEQKFQTKPTTFLKDSLKRFSKNKSSVVAAYILGFLILLSIIVPIVSPFDVTKANDVAFYNLEPKLFNNANGFWDGTVKKEHIAINLSTGLPDPTYYKEEGISNLSIDDESYTNEANEYGQGGYAEIGYYSSYDVSEATLDTLDTADLGDDFKFTLDLNETQLTLVNFETVDEDKIIDYQIHEELPELPEEVLPEGFKVGKTVLEFVFEHEGKEVRIPLTDNKVVHNIGSTLPGYSEPEINVNQKINDYFVSEGELPITTFSSFSLSIKTTANGEVGDYCSLIKNLKFKVSGTFDDEVDYFFNGYSDELTETKIPGIGFTDATELMTRTKEIKSGLDTYKNLGYWKIADLTRFVKQVYLSRCTFGSFTYDSYKGSLGPRYMEVPKNVIETWRDKGYIDYDFNFKKNAAGKWVLDINNSYINDEILNSACPLIEMFTFDDVTVDPELSPSGGNDFTIYCHIEYYKYIGWSYLPSFLFGTDKTGRDMFKYVFEGLRNSLLLGLFTFIVCFLFGLAWGAISGYFGGAVDLVMERITDILSGIPWIVVMTLVILKTNESSFWTFALALCLTGWIGTASLTRTQFYRFRGREYVLASRTLGASHGRLIVKHILPNAMGTIITSCVLMIPAIIFQEATISYLGLGFKNMSSLGVILSNNQNELLSHPYQLIFPSIVIALVMISFNLFGNGLRDAINPSLKGEDE